MEVQTDTTYSAVGQVDAQRPSHTGPRVLKLKKISPSEIALNAQIKPLTPGIIASAEIPVKKHIRHLTYIMSNEDQTAPEPGNADSDPTDEQLCYVNTTNTPLTDTSDPLLLEPKEEPEDDDDVVVFMDEQPMDRLAMQKNEIQQKPCYEPSLFRNNQEKIINIVNQNTVGTDKQKTIRIYNKKPIDVNKHNISKEIYKQKRVEIDKQIPVNIVQQDTEEMDHLMSIENSQNITTEYESMENNRQNNTEKSAVTEIPKKINKNYTIVKLPPKIMTSLKTRPITPGSYGKYLKSPTNKSDTPNDNTLGNVGDTPANAGDNPANDTSILATNCDTAGNRQKPHNRAVFNALNSTELNKQPRSEPTNNTRVPDKNFDDNRLYLDEETGQFVDPTKKSILGKKNTKIDEKSLKNVTCIDLFKEFKRLQCTIRNYRKKEDQQKENKLRKQKYLKDAFDKLTEHMNGIAKNIFWNQIILSTPKKNNHAIKFIPEEKVLATAVKNLSMPCYEILENIFILPHSRNLQDLDKVEPANEVTEELGNKYGKNIQYQKSVAIQDTQIKSAETITGLDVLDNLPPTIQNSTLKYVLDSIFRTKLTTQSEPITQSKGLRKAMDETAQAVASINTEPSEDIHNADYRENSSNVIKVKAKRRRRKFDVLSNKVINPSLETLQAVAAITELSGFQLPVDLQTDVSLQIPMNVITVNPKRRRRNFGIVPNRVNQNVGVTVESNVNSEFQSAEKQRTDLDNHETDLSKYVIAVNSRRRKRNIDKNDVFSQSDLEHRGSKVYSTSDIGHVSTINRSNFNPSTNARYKHPKSIVSNINRNTKTNEPNNLRPNLKKPEIYSPQVHRRTQNSENITPVVIRDIPKNIQICASGIETHNDVAFNETSTCEQNVFVDEYGNDIKGVEYSVEIPVHATYANRPQL